MNISEQDSENFIANILNTDPDKYMRQLENEFGREEPMEIDEPAENLFEVKDEPVGIDEPTENLFEAKDEPMEIDEPTENLFEVKETNYESSFQKALQSKTLEFEFKKQALMFDLETLFRNVLQKAIDEVSAMAEEKGKIGFVVTNRARENDPISIPFVTKAMMSVGFAYNTIQRALGHKEDFAIDDDLKIKITCVNPPKEYK